MDKDKRRSPRIKNAFKTSKNYYWPRPKVADPDFEDKGIYRKVSNEIEEALK